MRRKKEKDMAYRFSVDDKSNRLIEGVLVWILALCPIVLGIWYIVRRAQGSIAKRNNRSLAVRDCSEALRRSTTTPAPSRGPTSMVECAATDSPRRA